MQTKRKYVLTIAGFDPSGGAGVLADVKTFEQLKVYGLAVNTALTIQTENKFESIEWIPVPTVKKTLEFLLDNYQIAALKTGIFPTLEYLLEIIAFVKTKQPHLKIIVDPVISSSTGQDFMISTSREMWVEIADKIDLITPNLEEIQNISEVSDAQKGASWLEKYCPVLLKGGHDLENPGVDILFHDGKETFFFPENEHVSSKHGSGCILSAAITTFLANGLDLEEACKKGKQYVEQILSSNDTLLAYHNV